MKEIFINLKRFDVPRRLGGICPQDNPGEWAQWVIDESVRIGIGMLPDINVTYFFPEALLIPAITALRTYCKEERGAIQVGSQGVFREDIRKGGNFGAFTTNLPAASANNLGCSWAIIGHSEERKDKFELLQRFEPAIASDDAVMRKANETLNAIINDEVLCAFRANLNVLLCVGETAEERGNGIFEEQKSRIEAVLKSQIDIGLHGIKEFYPQKQLAIGYEPRWAIGPGKTPPGADYIGFVSAYLKSVCQDLYGLQPPVVYGGGLKEENAATIAGIDAIAGGLVALTKFTGDIAFEPKGLKTIIENYLG